MNPDPVTWIGSTSRENGSAERVERLDERADRVGLPGIDRVTVRDGVSNKSPQ